MGLRLQASAQTINRAMAPTQSWQKLGTKQEAARQESVSDRLGDEMPVPGVRTVMDIVAQRQNLEPAHQPHHVRGAGVVMRMPFVMTMGAKEGAGVDFLANPVIAVSL